MNLFQHISLGALAFLLTALVITIALTGWPLSSGASIRVLVVAVAFSTYFLILFRLTAPRTR